MALKKSKTVKRKPSKSRLGKKKSKTVKRKPSKSRLRNKKSKSVKRKPSKSRLGKKKASLKKRLLKQRGGYYEKNMLKCNKRLVTNVQAYKDIKIIGSGAQPVLQKHCSQYSQKEPEGDLKCSWYYNTPSKQHRTCQYKGFDKNYGKYSEIIKKQKENLLGNYKKYANKNLYDNNYEKCDSKLGIIVSSGSKSGLEKAFNNLSDKKNCGDIKTQDECEPACLKNTLVKCTWDTKKKTCTKKKTYQNRNKFTDKSIGTETEKSKAEREKNKAKITVKKTVNTVTGEISGVAKAVMGK